MTIDPIARTVTMTAEEYDDMQNKLLKLFCLEAGGVDNWDGYGFAMEEFWSQQED